MWSSIVLIYCPLLGILPMYIVFVVGDTHCALFRDILELETGPYSERPYSGFCLGRFRDKSGLLVRVMTWALGFRFRLVNAQALISDRRR